MQSFSKKLLLIAGLIAIFSAVLQQHFCTDAKESLANGKSTVVQFDKDNNRDTFDKAVIGAISYNQFSEKSSVYYFYSASYQEPTLLVHLRPPKA